jgi:hypothetical protein
LHFYLDVSGDGIGSGQLKDASMMILAAVVRQTTAYFLLQEAKVFVRRAVECRVGTELDVAWQPKKKEIRKRRTNETKP